LIRWRYYERPSTGGAWLICNDQQCVAMFDSFLRAYLLDGRRILLREGCDWYCLPKYRLLGLGVRLTRKMVSCPEPMLAIGGSGATLAMLPRLRWRRLSDARKYVLPVRARAFAGAVLKNRWPGGEVWLTRYPLPELGPADRDSSAQGRLRREVAASLLLVAEVRPARSCRARGRISPRRRCDTLRSAPWTPYGLLEAISSN